MEDILLSIGTFGGFIAFYLLLLRFLPVYLPPKAVRGPLHWVYWGSVGLVLLAIFVSYSPWDLRVRSAMFFYFVVVGSGLLAGLQVKLDLVSGRALALARAQTWLTPWLIPVLFIWAGYHDYEDVVYSDANVSIDFKQKTGWISDITSTQITLYQSRALLFEQRIGDLHAATAEFETKQWWATIRQVTLTPGSLQGVVQNQAGLHPFMIRKPWRGVSQPPAPSPEPTPEPPPLAADHVYNFVEEMPHLPGSHGKMPIEQAILSRLVLPRDGQEGRVFLRLEVDTAGNIRNLHIDRGLNASTDSAVLAAARHLPRLIPGRQNGRPVSVRLILGDLIVTKPTAGRYKTTKQFMEDQYTATSTVNTGETVDTRAQYPHLPGSGGDRAFQALEDALVGNFRYPAGVQSRQVNGWLYVDVVVTTAGKMTTLTVDRSSNSNGIPAGIDNAIRAALSQLPRLVPARLEGQPVAAKLQIRWSFSRSFSDATTHLQVAIEQPIKEFDLGNSSDLEGL